MIKVWNTDFTDTADTTEGSKIPGGKKRNGASGVISTINFGGFVVVGKIGVL